MSDVDFTHFKMILAQATSVLSRSSQWFPELCCSMLIFNQFTKMKGRKYNALAMKIKIILILGFLLMLPACLPTPTPTVSPAPDVAIETKTEAESSGSVTQTSTPLSKVVELNLWVTPRFAPDPSTPGGRLMAERLAEFEANYSNIDVSVRTKSAQGPGSILSALSTAAQIGPHALPDLVTLDPEGLQQAASFELIQPIDVPFNELVEGDWYPFAAQAAQIQNENFGLPFASDSSLFGYRTGLYPSPPESWADLLESTSSFLFAAGDPQAEFTIAQYLALGGEFTDTDGNPVFDPATLSEVLSFYNASEFAGRLPLYALQYSSAEETWKALQEKRSASAESPLNSFLAQADRETETAGPIPTRDGAGIALTETWSLAVASDDPLRMQAVNALLKWLLDPEFLGPWTHALGMIPASPEALEAWPEADAGIIRSMVSIAIPIPSDDVIALFGPTIQRAVEDVLGGTATPEEAALEALRTLTEP